MRPSSGGFSGSSSSSSSSASGFSSLASSRAISRCASTTSATTFLADELRVDALTLGVADALQDDLLHGLGADAAELRRLLGQLELVLELGVGVQLLGFVEGDLEMRVDDVGDDLLARVGADGAGLAVDLDAAVIGGGVRLLRAGEEGRLHRFEEDLGID